MLGYQLGRCERLLRVARIEIQGLKMIDCTLGCLSDSALYHLRDFISHYKVAQYKEVACCQILDVPVFLSLQDKLLY